MADIGFSDANTFSLGAHFYPSRAECPVHGIVGGDFRVFVTSEPEYSTGTFCPKCYVDWVKANVTAVTRVPLPTRAEGGNA